MADIRRAFVVAAPEAGLESFVAQWLDRQGAPMLDVDRWSTDRGKGIAITVSQRQRGEPFAMPLELAVETKGGGVKRFTVELAASE